MRNPDNEEWTWRAHYTDGETLDEFPDDGPDHGFRDIDLPRCYAIELVPQRPHLATHVVRIDPAQGQRPIFYRRRYAGAANDLTPDPVTGAIPLVVRQTIHVLGWQTTVGEGAAAHNVATYTYHCPDGTSLISPDPNAL